MSFVTVKVEPLRGRLIDFLSQGLELAREEAELTVDHFIRAEQAGKADHGLLRFVYITGEGKFGPFGDRPAPEARRVSPGMLHVEGAGHLGYPVVERLMAAGCAEAQESGICVATSRAVYPTGALGDWARLACAQGVAVVIVATSPPRVTHPGGTTPVVGTNPICIGVPTAPVPVITDGATSAITHGALLLARSSGEALPEGSVIGPGGEETTNALDVAPAQGLGALLPFGRSHKAFAISLAIELLVSMGGGLPGGSTSADHGLFCVFLGPKITGGQAAVMSEWVRGLDSEGVRVPGWESFRRMQSFVERGEVALREETLSAIKSRLAEKR